MLENRWTIVVAEPYSDHATAKLRAAGNVVPLDGPGDPDALRRALAGADALLVRTYTQVTRELLTHAPHLKVIGRGGIGLDNIDLQSAAERNIRVVNTPGAATEAVADLALGLMLSLLRELRFNDEAVRARAQCFADARGCPARAEMRELTVGIIGMGRIGRAVARRCAAGFGMAVTYNDIIDVGALDVTAQSTSKESLYDSADIITLHVPLTDDTRHLIDAEVLRRFKPDALLINTARGAVVDNVALAAALEDGQLGGAGLDVFEPEPLPTDHPLLSAPNTLFTPHIGARTVCAQRAMNDVVDEVIALLREAE